MIVCLSRYHLAAFFLAFVAVASFCRISPRFFRTLLLCFVLGWRLVRCVVLRLAPRRGHQALQSRGCPSHVRGGRAREGKPAATLLYSRLLVCRFSLCVLCGSLFSWSVYPCLVTDSLVAAYPPKPVDLLSPSVLVCTQPIENSDFHHAVSAISDRVTHTPGEASMDSSFSC